MTPAETAAQIADMARAAGLSVTGITQSNLSPSAYVTVRRADGRFFDSVLTKSRRRAFCAATGGDFPRLGDCKIRVSNHRQISGSDTHGSSHLAVRVDGDVAAALARVAVAFEMLAAA